MSTAFASTVQTTEDATRILTAILDSPEPSLNLMSVTAAAIHASAPNLHFTLHERETLTNMAWKFEERAFHFDVNGVAVADGCYENLFGVELILDSKSLHDLALYHREVADAIWTALG